MPALTCRLRYFDVQFVSAPQQISRPYGGRASAGTATGNDGARSYPNVSNDPTGSNAPNDTNDPNGPNGANGPNG